MRGKLRQYAAGMLKIKLNIMLQTTQQDRLAVAVSAVQEVAMRLHVKHRLDLLKLQNTHELQRVWVSLLRMALNA